MDNTEKQIRTLERLYYGFDLYTEKVKKEYPGIQCRSGCSLCCLVDGSPPATAIEWLYLEQLIKKQNIQKIYINTQKVLDKITSDLKAKVSEKPKLPCPLLDSEGGCSVYTHRPLICRLFGYTAKPIPLIKKRDTENYIYTCLMEIFRWKEERNSIINLRNKDDFVNILNQINLESEFKSSHLLLSWICNFLAINGYNLKNASNVNFIKFRT